MNAAAPLDVLHVVPTLEIGGLERFVVHLCSALRDRYRVGVACLKGEGPFAADLRARGIPVETCGVAGRAGAYTAFWRLRALLRRHDVALVHSHNTGQFFDSVLATGGGRAARVIYTDQGRDFPDKRRYMLGERWCARCAFRLVAVSDDGKRSMVRYEGIPAHRIAVIPNGVDTDPFAALPPPALAEEADVVIGMAARLAEPKDPAALVAAVALLRKDRWPVRLQVAGDGPLRPALEAQARDLGIADRVELLGYRTDMPEVLADFDVYVLSTNREGTPLGMVEAMAAARPVVATAVGGIPEVVEDGRTGLLVPPRDPYALAAALRGLLADRARARALGVAARGRAVRCFSLEVTANRYAALYDEALNGRAPAAGGH